MKLAVTVALLLLSLTVRSSNLVAEVGSDLYQRHPVPQRWIPTAHATSISFAHDYPRESLHSLEIADFVKVYGRPTYLVSPRSNKGYSYLVYEMSDGYKMLVYISDVTGSRFTAAQLFRPDGEAEGPTLK